MDKKKEQKRPAIVHKTTQNKSKMEKLYHNRPKNCADNLKSIS
jgi:hypothetical protein